MPDLHDDPPPSDAAAEDAALRRLAWSLGIGVVLALMMPPPLFAATMSGCLAVASGVMATLALVMREPIWPERLTAWDAAAMLYLLSLFSGFFVDLDAIQAFLLENGRAIG